MADQKCGWVGFGEGGGGEVQLRGGSTGGGGGGGGGRGCADSTKEGEYVGWCRVTDLQVSDLTDRGRTNRAMTFERINCKKRDISARNNKKRQQSAHSTLVANWSPKIAAQKCVCVLGWGRFIETGKGCVGGGIQTDRERLSLCTFWKTCLSKCAQEETPDTNCQGS